MLLEVWGQRGLLNNIPCCSLFYWFVQSLFFSLVPQVPQVPQMENVCFAHIQEGTCGPFYMWGILWILSSMESVASLVKLKIPPTYRAKLNLRKTFAKIVLESYCWNRRWEHDKIRLLYNTDVSRTRNTIRAKPTRLAAGIRENQLCSYINSLQS